MIRNPANQGLRQHCDVMIARMRFDEPLRIEFASWSKMTSRRQCRLFSTTRQCSRTELAKRGVSAAIALRNRGPSSLTGLALIPNVITLDHTGAALRLTEIAVPNPRVMREGAARGVVPRARHTRFCVCVSSTASAVAAINASTGTESGGTGSGNKSPNPSRKPSPSKTRTASRCASGLG